MNPELNNILQALFRWIHVVAGVIWIGHLYFFNWVNAPFQTKIDGPTKKLVNPELQPRALYWFRWGAAWTWFSGILLAALIYYHEKTMLFEQEYPGNPWLWLAIVLILLAVGFVIYNAIMKMLANKVVAAAICLALFAGVYALLELYGHFSGRALYIHAGAIFGTMMALNVWMVIWPNQKKILGAIKAGTPLAPDSPEVKIAGLRSRHNTYMSVPLIFLMISNHYPTMYGGEYRDACLAGVLVLGFFVVWLLYKKAGKVQGF
ncbi:MAG TPA: urate hydroxylase PuuD [Thermoanaerobaculia bacterium]|nr:urate hydroxylase PuuD [Thermoanaerobaculia bacterium]